MDDLIGYMVIAIALSREGTLVNILIIHQTMQNNRSFLVRNGDQNIMRKVVFFNRGFEEGGGNFLSFKEILDFYESYPSFLRIPLKII